MSNRLRAAVARFVSKPTTRAITAVAAASTLLTGCAGPELAHLAYQEIVEALNIQYRVDAPQGGVQWRNSLQALQPVQLKRSPRSAEAACQFDGLLVPYERTWTKVYQNGDEQSSVPPAPGVVAGYATLVYHKRCPGQPAQAILHMGEPSDLLLRADQAAVFNNRPVIAMDALSGNQDMRPQWLPQVIARATAQAASQPAAQKLLQTAHAQLAQAVPDQAAAIAAAVQALAAPLPDPAAGTAP